MLSLRSIFPVRKGTLAALAVSATGAFIGMTWLSQDGTPRAQDAVGQDQPVSQPAKKRAPKPVIKEKVVKPSPAPTPPAANTQAQSAAQSALPDMAVKLKENGAGTCAAQINGLAASTMGSVGQYNTASNWATGSADKRLVTVSIGQRYSASGAVPFAATNIVAAPNPQGTCDAFAFQVIPSPLSCAKLRETLIANGRQIGDLAGVPLIQDGGGQTMLIPTASETCVLVGIKTAYAK